MARPILQATRTRRNTPPGRARQPRPRSRRAADHCAPCHDDHRPGHRHAKRGSIRSGGTATSIAATKGQLRTEFTLARTLLFFRVGGLAQIAIAAYVDFDRYPSRPLLALLVVAVAIEGTWLISATLLRRWVVPWWIAADVAFCSPALVVCAGLTRSADGHSWVFFMYPFAVITSFGVGAAFTTVRGVAGFATLLAAPYLAGAIGIHHESWRNALPNALTHYPNAIVAWAIARQLRRTARELDEHRARAVVDATDLSRERERLRHTRMLHDRVLQTMEALAQGHWIQDPELKTHSTDEAAWLRRLVQGTDDDADHDPLAGLTLTSQRMARLGLRVNVAASGYQLADPASRHLTAPTLDALLAATQEALSNVAKRADADDATVRITVHDGCLTVSVLDHGHGFDPTAAHPGLGLPQSIRGRISEVGGRVVLETASGAGTLPGTVGARRGSPA